MCVGQAYQCGHVTGHTLHLCCVVILRMERLCQHVQSNIVRSRKCAYIRFQQNVPALAALPLEYLWIITSCAFASHSTIHTCTPVSTAGCVNVMTITQHNSPTGTQREDRIRSVQGSQTPCCPSAEHEAPPPWLGQRSPHPQALEPQRACMQGNLRVILWPSTANPLSQPGKQQLRLWSCQGMC